MLTRKLLAKDVVGVLQKAGLLIKHRMPEPELGFSSHTTDSRKLGPGTLFIAYKGVSFDAHDLVVGLQKKFSGLGFILESEATFAELPPEVFACLVRDSRDAWGWLAAHIYNNPQDHLRLIGITGTNGKTSTVWFLRQLLRTLHEPALILGTIGFYCGEEQVPATHTTPDPDELFRQLALGVEKGVSWAAMEVSSHALVQRRLGPLRFDAAAFTSFSRDHLDFHGTMEDYFAAKWQLFANFLKPQAVVWLSQDLADWLPAAAYNSGFHFYGKAPLAAVHQSQGAAYHVLAMSLQSTKLMVAFGAKKWLGELPFGADFAMANFTAALLIIEGLLPGRISAADWKHIEPVPGRFEPLAEGFAQQLAIIVDYAHTPDALEKTLLKLRELTQGQLWVVFGCGGERDRGKRPLMAAAAETVADCIIVTSDNPRTEDPQSIVDEVCAGLKRSAYQTILDREAAILYAVQSAKPGDSILIAGKGHEDYQIIGTQRFPFDDRKVASRCLQSRLVK